ncbi:hypothetical protein CAI21_05015 [Alkalilimnicola ehrlichii]|uniref:DUF4398 domain-containing protein n=1 Tax=Alkalilimnicola ehrlichii TaxID=351052 RepID=UPI000E2EE7CE|nr:DUF4398 domain-containing protein [Alkalilimnicola ehrlichii]RFA30438.1 hypothetical protein CAI21_05015 [Alkalilimnicola ehrlichii]
MSDARQAINAARAVGDELANPQALEEAELLIEAASRALSEGRYREARSAAMAAKRSAMLAREASLGVLEKP